MSEYLDRYSSLATNDSMKWTMCIKMADSLFYIIIHSAMHVKITILQY